GPVGQAIVMVGGGLLAVKLGSEKPSFRFSRTCSKNPKFLSGPSRRLSVPATRSSQLWLFTADPNHRDNHRQGDPALSTTAVPRNLHRVSMHSQASCPGNVLPSPSALVAGDAPDRPSTAIAARTTPDVT